MVEITKKYKQTGLNTLRLPVDFQKLKWDDDVILAYNVLQCKNKKKADYTTKAILRYKSAIKNRTVHNAITNIQNMKNIMSKHSIETEEDLENLLKTADLEQLKQSLPKKEVPRKMLLGFNMNDDESITVFNELFEMVVTERVLFISKAIVAYIEDGFDSNWSDAIAQQFLYDAAYEYQKGNDQFFMENMNALLESCKRINVPMSKASGYMNKNDKMSSELASLFISEQDISNLL